MTHEAVSPRVSGLALSNGVYDTLKWLVQILIPALAALYFTVGKIWGLPAVEEVVGTAAAVALFFGTAIGLSNKQYSNSDARFDGRLVVDQSNEAKDVISLEVESPLQDLKDRKEIVLKVAPPSRE